MGILTFLVQQLLFLALRIFFRDCKSIGKENIPKRGAVLFVVGPHANQFVDPNVLLKNSPRRDLSFLIAQKSLDRKYIGKLARALNSIGVSRPQDYAKRCEGTITSSGVNVTGENTTFQKDFQDGYSINIKEQVILVAKVISDTELQLKSPFEADIKEPANFKSIPKLDQSQLFSRVWDSLHSGQCIGIFPEGGSHDRTDLLPLKAGFAIMALGAMNKYPDLEVTIVPTGLHYFRAHRFRSRAFVEFGKPYLVPKELAMKYGKEGASKREAIATLLDEVLCRLKGVTVTAPDYETLQLFQACRRLYKPIKKKLTVQQKLEITRKFAKGYDKYKDHPKVKELSQKVIHYNNQLRNYGLNDHQVKRSDISPCYALFLLFSRLFRLIILFIFAFPGIVINIPAGIIISIKSKKKAEEALRASTVKIKAKDVIATWKILIGMVLLPLFYTLYAVAIGVLVGILTDLPLWAKIIIPILSFIAIPIISNISVRFFEVGHDLWSSIVPLFWAIFRKGEDIRATRDELQTQLRVLVAELGPTLFKDWQNDRIIRDSEIFSKEDIEGILAKSTADKQEEDTVIPVEIQ